MSLFGKGESRFSDEDRCPKCGHELQIPVNPVRVEDEGVAYCSRCGWDERQTEEQPA